MGLKAVLYIGLLGLGVGCSNSDPRLQGERQLLDGTVFVETDARFLAENLPDLRLPQPQPVPAWTHQGGNAQHIATHAELPAELTLRWSRQIGAGDAKRHQISAAPVAQAGQLYTIDSQSMVTALDETGSILWQTTPVVGWLCVERSSSLRRGLARLSPWTPRPVLSFGLKIWQAMVALLQPSMKIYSISRPEMARLGPLIPPMAG
jgi:hypothetical protein